MRIDQGVHVAGLQDIARAPHVSWIGQILKLQISASARMQRLGSNAEPQLSNAKAQLECRASLCTWLTASLHVYLLELKENWARSFSSFSKFHCVPHAWELECRASELEESFSARMRSLSSNAEAQSERRASAPMQRLGSNAKPQLECKTSGRMQSLSTNAETQRSNADARIECSCHKNNPSRINAVL